MQLGMSCLPKNRHGQPRHPIAEVDGLGLLQGFGSLPRESTKIIDLTGCLLKFLDILPIFRLTQSGQIAPQVNKPQ